ncbi:MAG TPA: sugar phosphate nucleotidyltransferase [Candidatus Deferrimicrobium sp.]|nr:sugar phosphate nucleotidyltransferase [Candidatus Deferrimicrobium sp.]
MKKEIKAVVLAAGKSKRMKSGFSKVVHKILGKEIIGFLLDSLVEAGIHESNIIVVAGQNLDELKKVIHRNVQYAVQQNQLGTADALLSAGEYLRDFDGDVLVTVGDNPYITAVELKKLIARHQEVESQCTLISAVFPFPPPPYGRIIRNAHNEVMGVVEDLDASPEQLEIREVNASIYMFANKVVFPLLFKIENGNQKGEYYLTDIIKILKDRNYKIDAVKTDDYFISIGINNRWELQEAQERFNQAHLKTLALEKGVTILQPETVTIEYNVEIGMDTVIYPSTYIAAGTKIGSNCRIGPFVYLSNVEIKDNEEISFESKDLYRWK